MDDPSLAKEIGLPCQLLLYGVYNHFQGNERVSRSSQNSAHRVFVNLHLKWQNLIKNRQSVNPAEHGSRRVVTYFFLDDKDRTEIASRKIGSETGGMQELWS